MASVRDTASFDLARTRLPKGETMSTISAPMQDFAGLRPARTVTRPSLDSAWGLVITYVLVIPILLFATRIGLSVDLVGGNSAAVQSNLYLTPETGQGSARHSAEILLAYGIVAFAMFPVWKVMWRTVLRHPMLLALPAWAILSTNWSQDPGRTLPFAVLALVLTLFGVYLPSRFSPKQQLQVILLGGLVTTLVSYALLAVWPAAAVDHKNAGIGVQGIYPHKNICSIVTLYFLTPAFFYAFQGKLGWLKRAACIVLIAGLSIITMSRTGWIVLLLLIAFVTICKFLHRLAPVERILVTGFLPAVALLGGWLIYLYQSEILRLLGKDPSLSGRTGIWQVVFLSIVKKPLIGFGYYAFWVLSNGEVARLQAAAGDSHLSNAENGVLSLWLEVGLIGIGILFALLYRATKNAVICFRSGMPNYAIWYMSLLFLNLLALGDGDKFMLPNAIEWPFFVLAYVGLANEARRVNSGTKLWT